MAKVQTAAVIAGTSFVLDRDRVEAMARALTPEPIREHFVVVSGRRFPPKQIIAELTDIDRNDFTTNQARGILRRLGFVLGRLPEPAPPAKAAEAVPATWSQEAENLRPYMGRWVALRGIEVLVAGDSPEEVYTWLEQHDEYATSFFRVPVDPTEDIGALDW